MQQGTGSTMSTLRIKVGGEDREVHKPVGAEQDGPWVCLVAFLRAGVEYASGSTWRVSDAA